MDACQWLTVAGAGFELLGLGTVALGIGETRRAFTDRPSLVGRFLRPVKRWWSRLRKKNQFIQAEGIASLTVTGSARVKVSTNWDDLSPEERVVRLQEYVSRHEEAIDSLHEKIDREEAARKAADKAEGRERDALRATLEQRITEAAAGGLQLETWGVGLFAFGVVLASAGSIMTCG